MLKTEMKKILIHQKGIWFLIFFLVAYVFLCLAGGYDSNYDIEKNRDIYESYISRWQGKLDEKIGLEIEEEYERVSHDTGEGIHCKPAFLKIYDQFYYVKEDMQNRYLMDERGWNTILTHDDLNILLILSLLALAVPIFCGEYSCEMDKILRSCRNGREPLARTKLIAAAILAAGVTLAFSIAQVLILQWKVGLSGAGYPLQSLQFFEQSPYTLSIGQAYFLVLLCRMAGAVWFVWLVAQISLMVKNMISTFFCGLTVALLPHLFGTQFLKYVLPLPSGFLDGTGYIWGRLTEMGYNEETMELAETVRFPGIMPEQLALISCSGVLLLLLLYFLSIRIYVDVKRTRKSFKRFSLLCCLILLAAGLSGCGGSRSAEISHDFLADASSGRNSRYEIRLKAEENRIYATDRAKNEMLLTRSPFDLEKDIQAVYVTEEACFYLCKDPITDRGFQIWKIDLDDYLEELFFDNTGSEDTHFWGLLSQSLTVDDVMENTETISSFMVDGNQIYYVQGDTLFCTNRLFGWERTVRSELWKLRELKYEKGGIVAE